MHISFRNSNKIKFKINNFYKSIFYALLSIILIVYCPLFLMLFFASFFSITKSRFSTFFFVFIALIIFVLLNLGKNVEGDLLSYLNLQIAFSNSSLIELLEKPQNFSFESGSYRTSEFIGYSFYWFIANYISSNKITFSIITTLLIYLPCILAYKSFAKYFNYTRIHFSIFILCLFFVGINFIQTTHVVRQYISASFFIFSISKYYNNKIISFILFSIIAIGFHNSIAILYSTFFIIDKLNIYSIYLKKQCLWFLNYKNLILLILVSAITGIIFLNNPIYLLSDNGSISNSALLIDIFLILFSLFISKKVFSNKFEFTFYLLYFTILLIVLAFVYLNFLIPALRLYLYLEFLRPVIISTIFFRLIYISSKSRLFLYLFVFVLVSFFLIRFIYTPWTYFNKSGFNSLGINLYYVIKSFI